MVIIDRTYVLVKFQNIREFTLYITLRVDEYGLGLASRYGWFRDMGSQLPWISEGVDWLLDNRPPEPEPLSVCHGDFHALNILVKGEVVTGVVDWGELVKSSSND